MCLRQKIISLGNEEGCPYDENLVQKRFLHTIETGLRNNNIRSELRDNSLKRKSLDDGQLLKAVSEAVANETERSGKLYTKKRDTVVNSLNSSEIEKNDDLKKPRKENNLHLRLEELKLNQEKEIAAMRSDLLEIKSVLKSGTFSGDNFGNEKVR